jgi:hypothetical protein
MTEMMMADQIMNEILERLRALGDDWHKKLADEMTAEERAALGESLESKKND